MSSPAIFRHRHAKIMFVVTEDWYFVSHRLPLAIAARDAGFDVIVATRPNARSAEIVDAGLTLLPLPFSRASINPLREGVMTARLTALYRRHKPDIVHHVAMKPVIYGSIAARAARCPSRRQRHYGSWLRVQLGFIEGTRAAPWRQVAVEVGASRHEGSRHRAKHR